MNNSDNKEMVFEDISSHSPQQIVKNNKKTGKSKVALKKASATAKKFADKYGNSAFKNIDRIIKIIAFVVSIAFFLLFLLASVILFLWDRSLIFIAALLLLFGAAISLIFLFLIYGLGEMLSQNKEILRRTNYN